VRAQGGADKCVVAQLQGAQTPLGPPLLPACPDLQLTQLPGTSLGSQPQQWVEALLLQAAEGVGFSGGLEPDQPPTLCALNICDASTHSVGLLPLRACC
jgi:hypothetical protein